MEIALKALGFAVIFMLYGCSTSDKLGQAAPACDVSWIGGGSLTPQRACELRVLSKRCAVSDQCQIQCEAKGELPHVGGGCSHVCQGGGGAQTDDDIAKGGGSYATAESAACYNQLP